MDKLELKKFRTSFILFWIGQMLLLIAFLSFDGRFKFLPQWLTLLEFFNPIGWILVCISLVRLRNTNHQFFLSLVTYGIFVAIGVLKSVCVTSTDEFFINWAKGLDWSIQILKCIIYVYFFLGCYHYFHENGFEKCEKRARMGWIIFVSLVILERLTVFLLFFDGIRANIAFNRVLTFGQIFINIAAYIYLVVILTNLFININKKRKELTNNEEAK